MDYLPGTRNDHRSMSLSDGSVWPTLASVGEFEHRLRYEPGSISRGDLLFAASVLEAYRYLVGELRQKKRDLVARELRAVEGRRP